MGPRTSSYSCLLLLVIVRVGHWAVSKHPPGTMVFSLLLPPASSIHHQHQYHQCTTITSIIRISSPLSLAISVAASSISGIISSTISILRSYQEPYQVTRSSSINSMHDLSSKKEISLETIHHIVILILVCSLCYILLCALLLPSSPSRYHVIMCHAWFPHSPPSPASY